MAERRRKMKFSDGELRVQTGDAQRLLKTARSISRRIGKESRLGCDISQTLSGIDAHLQTVGDGGMERRRKENCVRQNAQQSLRTGCFFAAVMQINMVCFCSKYFHKSSFKCRKPEQRGLQHGLRPTLPFARAMCNFWYAAIQGLQKPCNPQVNQAY